MKTSQKIRELEAMQAITVLLIEDSMEDGVAICKALIEGEMFYSFRVIRKYSLEGAITFLKSNTSDIVLLDLGLPDARAKDLKAVSEIHKLCPHIPIVIVSGYSDVDMVHRALECGAQEFLIKGEMSNSAIRQSMYQAIARKKIEQARRRQEGEWL